MKVHVFKGEWRLFRRGRGTLTVYNEPQQSRALGETIPLTIEEKQGRNLI
jgi:hypothetical protein